LTFRFTFGKERRKEKKVCEKALDFGATIWAYISAFHIQIKPLIREEVQIGAKLFIQEPKA